ncbi:ABC transporter ATP-binding protein, partial [Streptomyces sp. NPDC057638]|uniref:ABC transporter ATP-binding protein n=1 Tax=Streptomyces sp. NPDC057638 TaxID=3346190 RepID=UPI00367E4BAC
LVVVGAVVGVVLVASRTLPGAWAPAAMALALGTLAPVADAAAALGRAAGLRAAAARVGAAVRAPAGAPEPRVPRALPEGRLGIRMRGVRFDYGGGPVLDGLDLEVPAGETLALVGVSGAGKSTCAQLLARFWDPAEGSVALVGDAGAAADLRTVADAELRRAVAVVGQNAPLFHGTLADNLRLAAPGAGDAELRAVAAATGVDALVAALPDGYESPVGERGATLSGGQRARVALARALLTRPRVLVLDETTAALDGLADAEVLSGVREILPDCTTVVIAHRTATIRRADRIAVLEAGRVAELGTWDELTPGGGALARVLGTRDEEVSRKRPVGGSPR